MIRHVYEETDKVILPQYRFYANDHLVKMLWHPDFFAGEWRWRIDCSDEDTDLLLNDIVNDHYDLNNENLPAVLQEHLREMTTHNGVQSSIPSRRSS